MLAQPVTCALEGARRGHHSRGALRTLALQSSTSDEPRCVALAQAVADWLDRDGFGSCDALTATLAATDIDDDADLTAITGMHAWRCGRPQDAHRLARRALELDERSVWGWVLLGKVLEARWMETAANIAYARAIALDPDEPDALLGQARLLEDRAQRRAALLHYLQVAAQRGESSERTRGAYDTLEFVEALADRRVWLLERARLPGEIPFTILSDRPGKRSGLVIQIAMGESTKIPALLDTGASGLHIAPTVQDRSGFLPLSEGTIVGGGGKGQHEVQRGVIPRLDLGPIVYREALGTIAPRSLHPQGIYRAIVGADLLGGTEMRYRRGTRAVTLTETDRYEVSDDPRQAEPFAARRDQIPILRIEGQLLVPVTLSQHTAIVSGWMLFDTGASSTFLDTEVAERLGALRRGGVGNAQAYGGALGMEGRIAGVHLEVGGFADTLGDAPVIDFSQRSRLSGITVMGYLGLDMLVDADFSLDLSRGLVRIDKP